LNSLLVGARTSLGNAYLLQGKFDLARKSFREVLQMDSGNLNARFGLAKVEASLQNYQKSLEVAQPIVPQLSASDDGILLLATDYGGLGRSEELASLACSLRHSWSPCIE